MSHDAHATDMMSREAGQHPHAFARAFNSGDPELLDRMYEPDALFITPDGKAVVGDERRRANAAFQGRGAPIRVHVREVHEHGDVALLIVDWRLEGTDVSSTATDVARRSQDGRWRYAIDNPFGVAQR